MAAEIYDWPSRSAHLDFAVRHKISEVLAILYAIDAGELLSALPECEIARANHQTGLTLLAVVERELASIFAQVNC